MQGLFEPLMETVAFQLREHFTSMNVTETHRTDEQGFRYQKTPHDGETEESQKMSKQKVSKEQQLKKKNKQTSDPILENRCDMEKLHGYF